MLAESLEAGCIVVFRNIGSGYEVSRSGSRVADPVKAGACGRF